MAKITLEVNGQVFVADSAAGPGSCRTCALYKGRQCKWSLICGDLLSGANFRLQKDPVPATNNLEKYYSDNSYSGD